MRRSIGYGAYDNFGEDVSAGVAPDTKLYKGSTPIRFGRGSVEINTKGKNPEYKRYTFEAGMTPFGMLIAVTAAGSFFYLVYRLTGKLFWGE